VRSTRPRKRRRARLAALLTRIVDAHSRTLDGTEHSVVVGIADPYSGYTPLFVQYGPRVATRAAADDTEIDAPPAPFPSAR
jgi:hypothetical protein